MHRARVCRLLALALSTVVLGGCTTVAAGLTNATGAPAVVVAAPTSENPPIIEDRRVFVEGDSLTAGISPFLPALLEAGDWTVTLDDQVGRTTPTGIGILAVRASEIGGTLVVALGTNDEPDATAFSSQIDQVMSIAADRRVIWVTIARAGWDRMNDALLSASARWANLQVIDWRPVIAAHPAMLAADGIHLTEDGYQLRAQFIAAAVSTSR